MGNMKQYLIMLPLCLLLSLVFIPGAVAAQTCKSSIVSTTPDAGFTLRNDGTAIHNVTGLTWMRCSLGQNWDGKGCGGTATAYTWEAALQAAAKQSFAGQSDWRLPSRNELETILEESCHSPAINEKVFPATPPAYYWTSSPYTGLANGAWSVDFGYGSVNASVKTGNLNVRLVRGGR